MINPSAVSAKRKKPTAKGLSACRNTCLFGNTLHFLQPSPFFQERRKEVHRGNNTYISYTVLPVFCQTAEVYTSLYLIFYRNCTHLKMTFSLFVFTNPMIFACRPCRRLSILPMCYVCRTESFAKRTTRRQKATRCSCGIRERDAHTNVKEIDVFSNGDAPAAIIQEASLWRKLYIV